MPRTSLLEGDILSGGKLFLRNACYIPLTDNPRVGVFDTLIILIGNNRKKYRGIVGNLYGVLSEKTYLRVNTVI